MLKSVLCQRVKCYKSSLHDVCSPTKQKKYIDKKKNVIKDEKLGICTLKFT